jgi:hypothetical protein
MRHPMNVLGILALLLLGMLVSAGCNQRAAKDANKGPKKPPAGANPAEAKAFEILEAMGAILQFEDAPEGKSIAAVNLLYIHKVGDFKIADLAGLKRMHYLGITDSPWITDERVKEMAELTQLRTLLLSKTKVTDAGLKEIAGLTNLRHLGLQETAVTDAGMKHVAAFKDLETLGLYATNVGDAGLKELTGLTRLKKVDAIASKVTVAGAAEFQKAIPSVKVSLTFDPPKAP